MFTLLITLSLWTLTLAQISFQGELSDSGSDCDTVKVACATYRCKTDITLTVGGTVPTDYVQQTINGAKGITLYCNPKTINTAKGDWMFNPALGYAPDVVFFDNTKKDTWETIAGNCLWKYYGTSYSGTATNLKYLCAKNNFNYALGTHMSCTLDLGYSSFEECYPPCTSATSSYICPFIGNSASIASKQASFNSALAPCTGNNGRTCIKQHATRDGLNSCNSYDSGNQKLMGYWEPILGSETQEKKKKIQGYKFFSDNTWSYTSTTSNTVSSGYTDKTELSKSVSASFQRGFSLSTTAGYGLLGTAHASVTAGVSENFGNSQSYKNLEMKTISSLTSSSTTNTIDYKFTVSGFLWKWKWNVTNEPCTSFVIGTTDMKLTPSLRVAPCCLPWYFICEDETILECSTTCVNGALNLCTGKIEIHNKTNAWTNTSTDPLTNATVYKLSNTTTPRTFPHEKPVPEIKLNTASVVLIVIGSIAIVLLVYYTVSRYRATK